MMEQRRLTPAHRIRRKLRKRDSAFHPSKPSYKWWLLANVMIASIITFLGMLPVFLLHTKRKDKQKDDEYAHQLE
jgi:hypothetical protein